MLLRNGIKYRYKSPFILEAIRSYSLVVRNPKFEIGVKTSEEIKIKTRKEHF